MVKKLQYLFLYTLLGLQSCSGAEEEVKFTFVRVVKWGSLLQPVIKSEEISLVKKGKLLDFVLEKIKNKKDKEKIQFISKDHNWQQIAFSGKDSKKAVRTTISKVPIMYYTEKQVKERINKSLKNKLQNVFANTKLQKQFEQHMDKKKENNNNKQKSDTSEPKEDELLIESNNENNNNNKQKSDTPEPKGDELFIENDNENNDKQGISGLNQGSAKMPNKNLNVPKQRLSKKNNKRPTLNVVSETTKEIMNFYRSRRRTRVSKDRYSQPSADQEDKSLATAVSIVSLLVFNYVITKFLSSFLSLSNDGSYLRSTSEA